MDRYTADTAIREWSRANVCAVPVQASSRPLMTVPVLLSALRESKSKQAALDACFSYLSQQGTFGNGKAQGIRFVEEWWARQASRNEAEVQDAD